MHAVFHYYQHRRQQRRSRSSMLRRVPRLARMLRQCLKRLSEVFWKEEGACRTIAELLLLAVTSSKFQLRHRNRLQGNGAAVLRRLTEQSRYSLVIKFFSSMQNCNTLYVCVRIQTHLSRCFVGPACIHVRMSPR